MKFIRIFLLVLIIIGLSLLATQKMWVPPLVTWIISNETSAQVVQPISVTPHPKEGSGTLLGSVTLSPTCPVERMPPDPKCAPKPYVTGVKVLFSPNMKVAATGMTASDGCFKFNLAPGAYVVQATSGAVYPRCSPVTTQVVKAIITTIAVTCDSGIR